jgi:hypothetical protein
MYANQLVEIGCITEEFWDEWTETCDNLVGIDIPEDLLRKWYEESLVPAGVEGKDFEDWFWNYSIADDMDGFFNFTEWRPRKADVVEGF